MLHVCNAIGTPVETKQIDFEPKSIAMNKTHVYVSNGDFILDWQFRTSANLNANSSNNPNAPNKEAKFSAIDGKVMTGRIVIINNY